MSDTLLRELAQDFASQNRIILKYRQAEVKCDTIIDRQARLIQDWKDQYGVKSEEVDALQRKRKRARSWRWVERVGLLGAGIFIGTKL